MSDTSTAAVREVVTMSDDGTLTIDPDITLTEACTVITMLAREVRRLNPYGTLRVTVV